MNNKVTKHKMKFLLLTIICFLFFTGCSNNLYVLRGDKVELTEKTMTIPAVAGRTMFLIKRELIKAGWKLKIADSSLKEEQISSKTMVKEVKFDTAYRLYFFSEPSRAANVTISIVENETNEMVLEMFASLCCEYVRVDFAKTIVKELEKKE